MKPRRLVPVALAGFGVALGANLLFALAVLNEVDDLLHPRRVQAAATSPDLAKAVAVAFTTADGLTLRGSLFPPRNGATVIVCHGHGQDRTQMLPEALLLTHNNVGVLLFDWRAHGESEGIISTRGDRERLDLEAAIIFLSGRADVDASRLGVLGFSRGGSVAIEVAAMDPRLRGVIAEAPMTSLSEALLMDVRGPRVLARWPALWAARRAGIDIEGFQPEVSIFRIGSRPILIIQGALDRSAPLSHALRLYSAAREPKSLWVIDTAAHGRYIESEPVEYERRLVSFFTTALGP